MSFATLGILCVLQIYVKKWTKTSKLNKVICCFLIDKILLRWWSYLLKIKKSEGNLIDTLECSCLVPWSCAWNWKNRSWTNSESGSSLSIYRQFINDKRDIFPVNVTFLHFFVVIKNMRIVLILSVSCGTWCFWSKGSWSGLSRSLQEFTPRGTTCVSRWNPRAQSTQLVSSKVMSWS